MADVLNSQYAPYRLSQTRGTSLNRSDTWKRRCDAYTTRMMARPHPRILEAPRALKNASPPTVRPIPSTKDVALSRKLQPNAYTMHVTPTPFPCTHLRTYISGGQYFVENTQTCHTHVTHKPTAPKMSSQEMQRVDNRPLSTFPSIPPSNLPRSHHKCEGPTSLSSRHHPTHKRCSERVWACKNVIPVNSTSSFTSHSKHQPR